MSADKYAQFIAEQQKKLSVSGTNPVNLIEKKELSDKQKDIAKLAGDEDEIESEDLKKLRDKKDDDKDDDKKSKSKKEDDDEEDKDDVKEEVEQLDEVGDTEKGQKALNRYMDKASKTTRKYHNNPDWYSDGRVDRMKPDNLRNLNNRLDGENRAFARSTERGRATVYDKNKMADKSTKNAEAHKDDKKWWKKMGSPYPYSMKEEALYISEEESDYLAEMVAKGKLPEIADFHKKAADHALKMRVHHQGMADKSEDVGDHDGFEHHIDRAMRHDYDHEHHLARYDHAISLKARNQAMKDLKVAKDNAAKARDAKRDWA